MDTKNELTPTGGHVLISDEDFAYATAVIKKQAGLPADQADVNAAALAPDQLAALVAAGRNGEVARCREILGLE